MSVITLTKENFEAEVINSENPVMIDFWASWCGPCRMLSPVVDELAQEHPEIKVGKINVDDEEEIAERFGIMSIPALLFFKGGELVSTSVGFKPKAALEEIIETLKQ